MRLDAKLPPKKPLRVQSKPRAPTSPVKPRGVSWWTAVSGPAQREEFITAARARAVEMASDPVWQRPSNFSQIGTT